MNMGCADLSSGDSVHAERVLFHVCYRAGTTACNTGVLRHLGSRCRGVGSYVWLSTPLEGLYEVLKGLALGYLAYEAYPSRNERNDAPRSLARHIDVIDGIVVAVLVSVPASRKTLWILRRPPPNARVIISCPEFQQRGVLIVESTSKAKRFETGLSVV